MAEKKYQVFISSTYKDLIDERRDIARSVLDLGHIPAAMEYFPAMDEEQLEYIKRVIDECDYYVLVVAGKYGSVDNEGVSYTEREYDYALSKDKIVLGFPISDMTKLPRNQTETDENIVKKLEAFRAKLMTGRLIRTWQDRKDLDLAIVKGLTAAFQRFPQEGWVRTPKNSNEHLLEQIVKLQNENEELNKRLSENRTSSVHLIDGLADLHDTYDFLFTSNDLGGDLLFKHILSMAWIDIFIQFAGTIKSGAAAASFRSTFVDRLGERAFSGSQFNPSAMYAGIRDHDYSVICAQLTALGFIKQENSDMYTLTSEGELAYLSSITVRKKPNAGG